MDSQLIGSLSKTNFAMLDWIIVICYLSLSVVIGLLVKKFVRNMKDYIGAGRAVGTWLGIATLTGTEMGLITIMYSAQKGFVGGFAAYFTGEQQLQEVMIAMVGAIFLMLRSVTDTKII